MKFEEHFRCLITNIKIPEIETNEYLQNCIYPTIIWLQVFPKKPLIYICISWRNDNLSVTALHAITLMVMT